MAFKRAERAAERAALRAKSLANPYAAPKSDPSGSQGKVNLILTLTPNPNPNPNPNLDPNPNLNPDQDSVPGRPWEGMDVDVRPRRQGPLLGPYARTPAGRTRRDVKLGV